MITLATSRDRLKRTKKDSTCPPQYSVAVLNRPQMPFDWKSTRPCRQPHVARNRSSEPYTTVMAPHKAESIHGW